MVDDSEVKTHVERELEWDPVLDASEVAVVVNDGVVTLTGSVHRYVDKLEAERAAKRVKGVRGVANDVEVRIGKDGRTDADIAHDAISVLQMQLPASSESIKVVVDDGHVKLEGQVQWNYQRLHADAAVGGLAGVKDVLNKIVIAPAAAAREVRGAIQAALHRNAQIEANRISIDSAGGRITLNGTVKTWGEREAAERAAWMAEGVNQVRNNITIGP